MSQYTYICDGESTIISLSYKHNLINTFHDNSPLIPRVGEGDCDKKGKSDEENSKESDGEDSYSEEEGDGETSIPAIVITKIIINAFILTCRL